MGNNLGDRLFRITCRSAALLVIAVSLLLVAVLVHHSWLAIRSLGASPLLHVTWDPPVEDAQHRPTFGALAFVYGTVATSALALLLAVPFGVGSAAFLAEIAPAWLRKAASFLIEMLAAIPSVVYGFWGMFFLAPALQKVIGHLGGPAGNGGLGIGTAGLILAIMIVPYVAAVSYDVCRAVPRSQREGSLALGATRWQTIWSVVLPYARPGIVGACFLALGRALGETMAVTMLIGNRPEIKLSPFALGDSIASAIANKFNEAPYDLERSVLVELGLVLLCVTIAVNSLARLLIWRVGQVRKTSRKDRAAAFAGKEQPSPAAAPELAVKKRPYTVARWIDRLMTGVLCLALICTLGPLFLILGYVVYEGVGALDWDFFTRLPVGPTQEGGGMANALWGSTLLVGLATLLATPVGIFAAIYLAEYRGGRLGASVRFVGELLGGVPSIVIGIFAATLIARPLHLYGWAGIFALGVMMIPIVMRASEESLKLVPQTLRQASYALGASQWQTVLRVSVPAALPAIITGVFLAIARIAGETAPLLLTAGDNKYLPTSLGDYTPALPVYIYNYAISSVPNWRHQAWGAAFVLLVVVMLLNFGVRLLTGRRVVLASRAD
jgi:phosphate transport system permease protein